MKKIFLYSLMLITTLVTFSCKDDDGSYDSETDRLFMPEFRTRFTLAKGSSSEDICQKVGTKGNDIFLAWSQIDDAKEYQIRMSTEQKVSGGEESWENPDNVILDTIMPAGRDTLTLHGLNYSTAYRFAIRAISPRGEEHNSKWWGYGDGQHWADYLSITTDARYSTPNILYQKSNITTGGVTVMFNRTVDYDDADYKDWAANFNKVKNDYDLPAPKDSVWRCDYLTITASQANPTAVVPDKYKEIPLTKDMFDENGMGEFRFEGLDSNSVYLIDIVDKTISNSIDAVYNTMSVRTKGTPDAPIKISPNVQLPEKYAAYQTAFTDTAIYLSKSYTLADYGLPSKCVRINTLLKQFMSDNTMCENQTFYLEGGVTYFMDANLDLYKGFTLKTDPEDIAAGKGRAKLIDIRCINAPGGSPAMFMLGRQPVGGENPNVGIDIDQLCFEEIDFDFPFVFDSFQGSAAGNYFFNQYSGGMGINLTLFSLKNCSFQRFIRGFARTQCKYGEYIKDFIVDGCEFYNCGGYSGNGSGYGFVTGDMNNKDSNIFHHMVWRNNTFYETPIGNFITHGTKTGSWDDPSLVFDIELTNNTFVNWNTYSGRPMISLRSLPLGSKFVVKNNLFVNAKASGDEREFNLQAADVRTLDGVCANPCEFDFENNWSTNDYINESTGQVFATTPFDATKNSFAIWSSQPEMVTYTHGVEGLRVNVANISAAELMQQPNPGMWTGADSHEAHTVNCIDGVASSFKPNVGYQQVNLYFKNTNNEIYNNNVGASKWRSGSSASRRGLRARRR